MSYLEFTVLLYLIISYSFRLAVRQRLLIFAVPQVLRMTMVLPTFAETKVGRTEG